jgi:hypothetical protein
LHFGGCHANWHHHERRRCAGHECGNSFHYALRHRSRAWRSSASTKAGRAWWTAAISSSRSPGASVGGILQLGGTILGTARSEVFRSKEGRRKLCINLVNAGIDGMAVIGGDGSLTGGLLLYQEWEDTCRPWLRQAHPTGEGRESDATAHRRAARLHRQ